MHACMHTCQNFLVMRNLFFWVSKICFLSVQNLFSGCPELFFWVSGIVFLGVRNCFFWVSRIVFLGVRNWFFWVSGIVFFGCLELFFLGVWNCFFWVSGIFWVYDGIVVTWLQSIYHMTVMSSTKKSVPEAPI